MPRKFHGNTPPERTNCHTLRFIEGGERLDVCRDARTAGRENLPASDATTPTELETEIIRSFERLHRECGEPARVEFQGLVAQFTTIEASLPGDRDLAACVVHAVADVDREVGSAGELPLFGRSGIGGCVISVFSRGSIGSLEMRGTLPPAGSTSA